MSVEEGLMTWTAHEVYDSFQVVPDDDLKPHSFFIANAIPNMWMAFLFITHLMEERLLKLLC